MVGLEKSLSGNAKRDHTIRAIQRPTHFTIYSNSSGVISVNLGLRTVMSREEGHDGIAEKLAARYEAMLDIGDFTFYKDTKLD